MFENTLKKSKIDKISFASLESDIFEDFKNKKSQISNYQPRN